MVDETMPPPAGPGPRLMAFVCSDSDDENQRIVFAVSGAAARAAHAETDSIGSLVVRRETAFDQYAPGPVPMSAMLDQGWYSHCSDHGCGRRISYEDGNWAEPGDDPRIVTEAEERAVHESNEAAWHTANPEPPGVPKNAPHAERYAAQRAHREWVEAESRISPFTDPPMLDRTALRFAGGDVYCSLACQQNRALSIARTDLKHREAEKEAARRWPGAPEYASGRWPQTQPQVMFRPEGFEHDVRWNVDEDAKYVMPSDVARWQAAYADKEEGGRDG